MIRLVREPRPLPCTSEAVRAARVNHDRAPLVRVVDGRRILITFVAEYGACPITVARTYGYEPVGVAHYPGTLGDHALADTFVLLV